MVLFELEMNTMAMSKSKSHIQQMKHIFSAKVEIGQIKLLIKARKEYLLDSNLGF